MKICEFTQHDLEAIEPTSGGRLAPRTPMEQAMALLVKSLEAVNNAGLEGKKLSNLRIVQRSDHRKHRDDQVIEIHASVTHRLRVSP